MGVTLGYVLLVTILGLCAGAPHGRHPGKDVQFAANGGITVNFYFCNDNTGIDKQDDNDDDNYDSDDDIYAVPVVYGDYGSGSWDYSYESGSGSGDYWYGSGSGDYWYGSGSGDYWYGSGSGDNGSGSGDNGSGSGDNNHKPIKPSGGDYSDYNPIFVNSNGDKGSVSDKKPFTGIGTGTGTRPGETENQILLNFLNKQQRNS